jgi:RimJ/RimL family protein N-acetyltransferase
MIALAGTPVIETERLVLRAPEAGDWLAFQAFLASERGQFVRTGDYDLSNTWRGFCHVIGHWVARGFGMFVFQAKGDATPLGATGPWFPETWPEHEISWSVWNPAAEGKGFAFEAAMAARDFAFQTLGWTTAVSYVAEGNLRSAALARRLGAAVDVAAPSIGAPPCLVFRHPAPDSRRIA